MSEYGYASYATCGIDTTDFYKEFEVTITDVSRATGISRKSVSRLPVGHASQENTEKIIIYLEEVSVADYDHAVEKCKKSIVAALKELESAWREYEKKENILDNYRVKYSISRKRVHAKKVTIWEVLRCVKGL